MPENLEEESEPLVSRQGFSFLLHSCLHATTYECESRNAAVLWAECRIRVGFTKEGLHLCGKRVFLNAIFPKLLAVLASSLMAGARESAKGLQKGLTFSACLQLPTIVPFTD